MIESCLPLIVHLARNSNAVDGQHGLVILRAGPHTELIQSQEERLDGIGIAEIVIHVGRAELRAVFVFGFCNAVGKKENAVSGIEGERDAVKAHETEEADGRIAVGNGINLAIGAHNDRRDVPAIDKFDPMSVRA